MKTQDRTESQIERNPLSGSMKCVWMLAGVVDYKLCDRQYNCQSCPLDRALRKDSASQMPVAGWGRVKSSEPDQSTVRVRDQVFWQVRGYELGGFLFYHPRHVWARIELEGVVRIGLDDFGQRLLGRVYSVHLPQPGALVDPGCPCWRVAHQCGETRLTVPVAGTVRQRNERLLVHPSLMNRDQYGQGWAFQIEPARLSEDLQQLYYGQQAVRWYGDEIEILQTELKSRLTGDSSQLGETLADGGELRREPLRLISPDSRQRLIDRFFFTPTGDRATGRDRRVEPQKIQGR